jgi:hypothetical protein
MRVCRCHFLANLVLISAVMSAPAARRQPSETTTLAPIRADLVGLLDARFLKPGSPILLKVRGAWQSGDCKLREGSILKGHVVDANVSSKNDRTSRVAMVVDEAQCNGPELVPMPLIVAAILAAGSGNVHRSVPQDALPQLMASGVNTSNMQTLSAGMAGRPGPPPPSNAEVFFHQTSSTPFDSPKQVSVGDVFGFSGLKLSVGTGPEQSSVLSVKGRNVSLQRDTQFVVVPAALIARASTPAPAASSSTAVPEGPTARPATPAASGCEAARADNPKPKLPVADPEPDVEVCAAPSCNIAEPDTTAIAEAHAQKSFPLSGLGYAPRSSVQLDGFDHEVALAYLGEHQLLVTFNPHKLVDRKDGGGAARVMRAAVLDTSTMRIIRMVDWYIADRKRYLWPAGDGRVLAHVGNELRLYGPGLEIERRIELQGPLAWVSVSPSRKNFATGVVLERHSKELHAQLAANEEPEEDMEIRVLDAQFQTTVTAIRSSRSMPPVLTDEGEVESYRQDNDHWHLVEHTWDRQTHSIAHVTSACMPQISSIAPDLLFVVTCGRSAGAKYRVLRRDGSLLLQGNLSSKELGQGAHAPPPGNAFVIGIAVADRTIGEYFSPSDLKEENLAVYRATDGKRILTVRVDSPAPTREAYVLAPGAGELAVLSGQHISFYSVPTQ